VARSDSELLPASSDASPRVDAVRAWYVVGILCLLSTLSFLDRFILSLLVQPISKELHLSDTRLGMLIGLSFGVLYALVGLPIAHMIDRGNRVRWVSAGVTLWSLATIASAFADGFAQLVTCRAGVAIGEAVLTPAAMSLIGDLFPRHKRATPTVVYTLVAAVMGAGAFILGGWAFSVASQLAPGFGMTAWRVTLILIGLPGLPLASLLLLTVREPGRIDVAAGTHSYASVRAAWGYVVRERKLYGFVFIGMSVLICGAAACSTWTPTVLMRTLSMTTPDAGYLSGVVGTVMGVSGMIVWPWFIERRTRRGSPETLLTVMACTSACAATAMVFFGLATSIPTAAVALGLFYFMGSTSTVLPALIVQSAAPSEMRGRLIAGNAFANNVIGFGFGPGTAALIAENVFRGPGALGSALALLGAVTGPVAFAMFLLARRQYGTAYRAADSAQRATKLMSI
jgi:MFS family permease